MSNSPETIIIPLVVLIIYVGSMLSTNRILLGMAGVMADTILVMPKVNSKNAGSTRKTRLSLREIKLATHLNKGI